MRELLVTSSLDPVYEGQNIEGRSPRHITIWPYFKVSENHFDDVVNEMGNVIEGFEPPEVIATDNAEFGRNNNVLVRRLMALGRHATLITLHTTVGSVVDKYSDTPSSRWVYEGYSPHVTYVDGVALDRGDYYKLKTMELIERDRMNKLKTVQKIWEFEEL